MKIKKGDKVQVMMGKDKGKSASVQLVLPKENSVVAEGVNEYKRHRKGRLQNEKSDIITITKPINVAKVALICPKCKKPTRVGYTMQKDEKKRMCKKCNKVI